MIKQELSPSTPLPALIFRPQLLSLLGCGRSCLRSAVLAGDLPEPQRFGKRTAWTLESLAPALERYGLAYLLPARLRTPTAQGQMPKLAPSEEARALERMDKLLDAD